MNVVRGARACIRAARDAWSGLLDLVYPPFCLICKRADESYLCPECIEKIDVIELPYCRKCGIPCDPNRNLCGNCQEREYQFDSARSVGVFEDVLREAIHALKYGNHAMMAEPLGELMARHYPKTYLEHSVDFAIPIPIHRSRLVERGFNQSLELARVFCRQVSLPLDTGVLVKNRKTLDQIDLPEERRFENMEGCFTVRNPEAVSGRRILLVDDVLTTGATINEAARTLRAAGAREVHGYTLARRM